MSDHGGYIVFGPCYVCGHLFTFNPHTVPSVPVDPETHLPLDVDRRGKPKPVDEAARARAVREPICETCIERVNAERPKRGLEPVRVIPGAYDAVEGLPE